MLSKRTINKLKAIGFNIKKAEEVFVDACRQAMAEMHGTHWNRRKDVEPLVEHLEREVRLLLCDADNGPQLERDTFNKYWSGAKKSLLFHIPFRMSGNLSYENCAKIQKIVANDRRKVNEQTKVEEAIRTIRAERRQAAKLRDNGFLRLPRPTRNSSTKWVNEMKSVIAEALNHPDAKPLLKKHPELNQIMKIVTDQRQTRRRGKNGVSS